MVKLLTFSGNYAKKKLSSEGEDNITTNKKLDTKGFLKKLYENVHASQRGNAIIAMTNGIKITIVEGKVYFDYSEKGIDPKDFGYEFYEKTKDAIVFFPQL